jgi:hypothetical protein
MGECYSVGEEEVKEDEKTDWVLVERFWPGCFCYSARGICIPLYSGQCISGVRVSLAFELLIVP